MFDKKLVAAVAAGAEMSAACGDWRVSFNEAKEYAAWLSDLSGDLS